MWGIAVLLLTAFALLLFGKIAKKRGTGLVLVCLGMAVWGVAAFLSLRIDDAFIAIMGFLVISGPICDLIAVPILRRRVIPPCVRAKRYQSGIANIILVFSSFLFIAFAIFLLVTGRLDSFGMIILLGLATVSIIISLIPLLFQRIEICGNGVWQYGRFWPWEEYESFSWQWKTEDRVELWLVPKSWTCPSTRLTVPREDREAVHQLLEANLPDLSK
jgi:hypothetical protein